MTALDDNAALRAADAQAQERLSIEEIASSDLLAITHLHRYDLAAQLVRDLRVIDLCCGVGYGSRILADGDARAVVGVDVAADAVAAAVAHAAGDPRLSFVTDDALRFVERIDVAEVDALVCFEGVEHVPDPDALADALARLVREGTCVVISLPNSLGFDEENPHHATEFGYEQAMALFARVGEPHVLTQHLADGSVVLDAAVADAEVGGQGLVHAAGTDPAWAHHWLALYNVPAADIAAASSSLRLEATPGNSSYMRGLERANAELLHENKRMARAWLGIHDSAAAAVVKKLEVRAKESDEWRAAAEEYRRRLRAPHHVLADRIVNSLLSFPGVARVLRRGRPASQPRSLDPS